MKVVHHPGDLHPLPAKICLAIGFFDGVHLGHQQVLRQTIEDAHQHEAEAAAVTFDRHPNTVVAPERTPPLIYSLPQKLRTLASLGPHLTLVLKFDPAFSRQTGEEFIRGLARDFPRIQSVCVGSTFTFGHRRGGNLQLLRKLGQQLGFVVHGLAAVSLDGKVVSSTRIRDAIQSGHLHAASQMLGRAYTLAGRVIRGEQLGHTLGFPTANLDLAGLALPPDGVYAAHALVNSRRLRAVLNIGVRPTLHAAQPHRQVEAHLLDFSGNLYGADMELEFVEKIRDEKKLPSADALRQQIQADIAAARNLF